MPEGAVSKELLIINKRGLHARASAKFVQTVERFSAEVWVTRGSETVGGTSIMGLMMLAAAPGTTIVVSAIGPEARGRDHRDHRARREQVQRRDHVRLLAIEAVAASEPRDAASALRVAALFRGGAR